MIVELASGLGEVFKINSSKSLICNGNLERKKIGVIAE